MPEKLVIVESPAKARTIARYLGKNYGVEASGGHVRDLPPRRFGVDVENGFEPDYVIMPRSRKTINKLKKDAGQADVVFLAPDPDREGEAIAWHLIHALNLDEAKVRRATFHEITRTAIHEAFNKPGELDMNLVNAQQARRILDRLVGYELSPLISKKIVRGLSAGRVQSIALRLVVEREEEIDAFKPQEYWEITAILRPDGGATEFEAKLTKLNGSKAKVENRDQALEAVEALKTGRYHIESIEKRKTGSRPAPPFITSSLQRAASSTLNMSPAQTMREAQKLYEGVEINGQNEGLITYMRTDSTAVSKQALEAVRKHIKEVHGDRYVPGKPNFYKAPKAAQAAHEAIRPTDISRKPDFLKNKLSKRQWQLYDLIYRRFVASQMKPAVYALTKVEIQASLPGKARTAGITEGTFMAKGREMIFDGYTRVMPRKKDEQDQILPPLEEKAAVALQQLEPTQHFTQPPPRYTEASLVRELERKGIGRPSTYAPTISTLLKRNYVNRQKSRSLEPTELGKVVVHKLMEHFPTEMDYDFTRKMEEKLDMVEEGQADWRRTLSEFYTRFKTDLDKAREDMVSVAETDIGKDHPCPECNKKMILRYSRTGDRFLGCSGFPECKHTEPLDDESEETEHQCPNCNKMMMKRISRKGNPYLSCSGYPDCRTVMGIDKDGKPVELNRRDAMGLSCPRCGEKTYLEHGDDGTVVVCGRCQWKDKPRTLQEALEGTEEVVGDDTPPCDECAAPMQVRTSKKGLFLGCSNYPQCKGTRRLGKNELPEPVVTCERCEQCGLPLVLRWGKYGRFLACSGFPKCKNTWRLPKNMEECPQTGCGGRLIPKASQDGQYLGCNRYPDCEYTEDVGEKRRK